jgi:hypothetical protein
MYFGRDSMYLFLRHVYFVTGKGLEHDELARNAMKE